MGVVKYHRSCQVSSPAPPKPLLPNRLQQLKLQISVRFVPWSCMQSKYRVFDWKVSFVVKGENQEIYLKGSSGLSANEGKNSWCFRRYLSLEPTTRSQINNRRHQPMDFHPQSCSLHCDKCVKASRTRQPTTALGVCQVCILEAGQCTFHFCCLGSFPLF